MNKSSNQMSTGPVGGPSTKQACVQLQDTQAESLLSIGPILTAFLHQPSLNPHRKPWDEAVPLHVTGEKTGVGKDSTPKSQSYSATRPGREPCLLESQGSTQPGLSAAELIAQMRAPLMGRGLPEPTSRGSGQTFPNIPKMGPCKNKEVAKGWVSLPKVPTEHCPFAWFPPTEDRELGPAVPNSLQRLAAMGSFAQLIQGLGAHGLTIDGDSGF